MMNQMIYTLIKRELKDFLVRSENYQITQAYSKIMVINY